MNTLKRVFLTVMFLFTVVSFPLSANASLVGRLPVTSGGTDYQAYYDTVLDVTWAANANIGGVMDWTTANIWAANLSVGGVAGWRLPNTIDTGAPGGNWAYSGTDWGYNADTSTSEMASLFYDTLGNLAFYDASIKYQPNFGLSNTGPFSNFQSSSYWSATEYAVETGSAWFFDSSDGFQGYDDKPHHHYALAVHSGDVNTVPVPAAVWLLGSGILGLAGMARKNN